jgi:prepilin-type processing-associated H-X9-DG protein
MRPRLGWESFMSDSKENLVDLDEIDGPVRKSSCGGILMILLVVGILGFCVLGILASLLMPALIRAKEQAGKAKCHNNIKGLEIAMIMYSNDYRFFPHMTSLKKRHTEEHVSDVYRTLIQLKYMDNSEVFICPQSEEIFIQPAQIVMDDPKLWDWNGVSGSAVPACKAPSKLSVYDNNELSYTYMGKMLNASRARSDDVMIADKSMRVDSNGQGNHLGGYNVGFADGHSEFIHESNQKMIDKLFERLILKE